MKRLLFIFALCTTPAFAAITLPTACTPAAATSCTLTSAPRNGDVLVSYAYRSNSATAATTPTGWNVIKSTSGSVNSLKVAWKFSDGTDTTCGIWTNATQTFCQDYRGGWITGLALGGIFGANTSGTTATSGAMSYPTFTLSNPLSSSWVACAGGSVSGTADSAPSGMTLRSGTSITNIMFADTNGVVASWPTTAGATPGVGWATACWEMVATPSTVTSIDNSNYIVHQYNYGIDGGAASGTVNGDFHLDFPLAMATSSNNLLKLSLNLGYSVTAPTISNIYCNADTAHATWTFTQITNADATDTTSSFVFYIAGATAGCTHITVVPSVAWQNAAARFTEFRQMATTSPVDVSVATGSAVGSNGIYVGQAITTTSTNDVVTTDCTAASMAGVTGGSSSTAIYQSGGTTILDGLPWGSIWSNAFLLSTASAITPTAALIAYSPNSACITVGWKTSAGAGTQPSGAYVVKYDNHNQITGASINEYSSNINANDAEVIFMDGLQTASAVQFTGLSDTSSGTTYSTASHTIFTPIGSTTGNTGGFPNIALNCAMPAGPTLYKFTGVNTGSTQNIVFYEVTGLDHSSASSCYDSTAGVTTASSVGSVSSATSMPSITPSTSSGVVLASSEMGTGTYTMGISNPTCGNFMTVQYPNYQDTSGLSFGNMQGACVNTSTSAQNWGWTNGAATQFNATAIALKTAAAAGVKRLRGSVVNQ